MVDAKLAPEGGDFNPIEHPGIMPDGVYFGLDEGRYHAALALSSGGIKHLRVSTLDFWARCPALNPEYKDEETDAKTIGRAYHKRIVEGKEAFQALYAAAVDPADYPRAVRTISEIKSAIEQAGGPIKGLASLKKVDLIARLQEYDPAAEIWEQITSEHGERNASKTLLPAGLIASIEIAAAMIERHPQLSKAFTGGMPEVSIFWHDRTSGTPCKARLDYLKPAAVIDLKSFENSIGLPVRKAIARAVANYRYHIQVALYLEAANAARRLIGDGQVFGGADPAFLRALCAAPERTWLWVWQQKGIAPLARGMVLDRGTVLDIGRMEVDQARHTFARCWEAYGTDPWVSIEDIATFDDTDFPAYISE
jgi:PDDEXK-like domain of unknown function (DUF3799)